ncbi:uncharacterized protein MAM_00790 [Metarhizium album ARSEF 1941]|uniref:Uncharacterized protein n=1 Tax=Metarhizium album (strain ARSEF 1941) TaxID=1081103 RepID=A0A0B2X608_METAS|nr:uncharacterized protein MAM_00790 [Metarhizium album ARSEF 1941]KHO01789.1 hypothetical protein MAM_00790 [Metarhizium album ARSEF 1941]
MSAPIDLTPLNKDSSSEYEPKIISILSSAINDLPPTEPSAETTAREIDKLYPSNVSAAEGFLWTFWTLLVAVAKKVPADDPRQGLLVTIVQKLKGKRDEEVEMWGQKTRVWSELPMLGPVMRDEWNLSPDFDGSEKDDATVQEWISLNSFAARIYGASLQSWENLGIWELRAGLEETPEDRPNAKDTRIATAYEWIVHAGKELYANGRQAKQLDAMEKRALKTGSLLKIETSGLSNDRWNFWRERLGVLGAGAGSGAAKEKAQRALDKMKEIAGS